MSNEFKACIIGAGAGGLSMARALKRRGITYDHYERHSDVGGVWDQNNPGSAMYDSAHMISSKTMSGFMGFPMPDDYPDYPGHKRILAYLRSFADACDLKKNIQFSTEITSAKRLDDGWEVTLSDGSVHHYDAVITATGLAWHPRMAEYPGEFSGEIIHSSKFRNGDIFRGKRVMIIGAGNSGVDIAAEAARTADAAFLSMRRAYHFIPKHVFGMPADVFAVTGSILPMFMQQWSLAMVLRLINGDVTRHGLQKPDHLPLNSHPIVNSQALHHMAHGDLVPKVDVERFDGNEVVFKDGSREQVDLIVMATGYQHKIPFVDESVIDPSLDHPDLFMRTLLRSDPSLASIGFIEINGGVYRFYDEFADIVANYYSDLKDDNAANVQAFEEIIKSGSFNVSGKVNYVDSPRHEVYANVLESARQVKKLRKKMGWKSLKVADLAVG